MMYESTMEGEGDFVSTFGVNHKRICMCQCSFSVLSGPLDAGSYSSVVMINTGSNVLYCTKLVPRGQEHSPSLS